MRGRMPAIFCDAEEGCTEWTIDWYVGTADNWRELMSGWMYDPYQAPDVALCPDHAPVVTPTGGDSDG